ncbi:hypothetical protein LTR08_004809 [Meristemomyces frigidus]|nr:hypothetical protein LTR08_004809 [Meristemomyces frigidus]
MEVCRAGEAMVRSRGAARTLSRRTALHHHARRAFTTTPHPRDDDRAQRSPGDSAISALLDSALDFDKTRPTTSQGSTSHFKTPSMQPAHRSPSGTGADYRPPAGSSMDELLAAMGRPGARSTGAQSSGYRDVASMLDPASSFRSRNSSTGNLPIPAAPVYQEKLLPIKLNASVGRRIEVQGNIDSARAFRQLEMRCARNSVRRDFGRQRFHERPGLKRKRLKGERWRRRFREGFRGVVALVGKMRRQGW